MKVVVAEKISSSALDLLREARWTVVTPEQLDGKLAIQLESADALIVRSVVEVTAELLAKARKLRVIGRAGVGVDNIDLDAATRQGIAVMNTPGANAIAVAEQITARHGIARQDFGHRRPGTHWHGSSAPGAGIWNGNHCARSIRFDCG